MCLDVRGQGGIRVGAGRERAVEDLDSLRGVDDPDDRRERASGVEPGDGVRRRLDPPAQVLDGGLEVERERFGEAELEQYGGSAFVGRWLVERAAQVCDGRVRRAAGHRLARGGAEAVAYPLRGTRLGGEEMRGDPFGSGILCGEHARRPLVSGRARRRRQLLVDGAANDRMHELQRAALGQDAAAAQRVRRFGGRVSVEVRERPSVPNEGAVADDRRGPRELLGGLREACEPRPDRRDDAVGRGREHVRCALRAGLAQRAGELAQEERVPAREGVAGTAERRHRLGDGGAYELRRPLVGERRRAHQHRSAALLEHRRDTRAAGFAERPRGDDEQDRRMAEPSREVGQEPERRRVGPVCVVDEQRERPVAGEDRGQAIQAVQGSERPLWPEWERRGLRESNAEQRSRLPRLREGRRGVAVAHRGLEQLPHDAEPERALELGPASGERRQPCLECACARLGDQCGLADPCGTLHDHRAPFAGGHGLDGRSDHAKLRASLQ
jgi:hypothetical protein